MAMGIDGQIPEETKLWIEKRNARDKARAVLVTGPKKIFNDAALAVERLSADVRNFWYDGMTASDQIKADISSLELLMKKLPGHEAELCQSVIQKTASHIILEEKARALDRDVGARLPPFALAGLSYELEKAFRLAGVRGSYHESLEYSRKRLEDRALAP